MKYEKSINVLLGTSFAASLLLWVWGNTNEQGDMSNAGYQVFGFLGSLISIFGFIIFNLWIRMKQKNKD